MNILLVAATQGELIPLLKKTGAIGDEPIKSGCLYSSTFNKKTLSFLLTGVGMVNTTFHIGRFVDPGNSRTHPNLIINIGVAGSFNKNIPLGEVVNVATDCFSEMGAEDGDAFLNIDNMGFADKTRFEASQVIAASIDSLRKVNGITVNTVHGNERSIDNIIKRCNPDVESMEGAAVMFAAAQSNIPCIQLRAISNYVERRNRLNWKLDLAIENLANAMVKIMEELV